jgi:CRP/FNR family transcriptional regulator, cyclic AMP receptor protein
VEKQDALEELSSVLGAMAPADRMLLTNRAVPKSFLPGDRLYISGDRSPWVQVLTTGVVKLVAVSPEGDETILSLATPGDLLGDVATLDGLGQPLDALAATDCEVLAIEGALFLKTLHRNPAAGVALAEDLARRVRWMCDTAAERTTFPVPARLASRLLDLADTVGRIESGTIRLEVPLDQSDIARLSGMCRETACRTLRRFKKAGVVDYDRKKGLRILRPDVLERVRCMGR